MVDQCVLCVIQGDQEVSVHLIITTEKVTSNVQRDRWRALVSTARNLRVPKMGAISGLAAEPVSFSRRTLLHGLSK